MARKVIRITPILRSDETEDLIALCDDGTIWLMAIDDKWEWNPLPPIPEGDTMAQTLAIAMSEDDAE